MITIACVLNNVGVLYNIEYVYKLKRAFERHLHIPHKFVCFTNTFIPDVTTIKLQHGWPTYWSKLEMFRPDVLKGPVIYCDLDVILTGDITELALYKSRESFFMIDDLPVYPKVHNSTLMWWDADNPAWRGIYELFSQGPDSFIKKHEWSSQGPENFGEQAFISDYVKTPSHWQRYYPPEWFRLFSSHKKLTDSAQSWHPKDGSKFWYALDIPKAHHCVDLPLVKQNWI